MRFQLICDQAHEFEGWFRSGDDFESQNQRGLVQCAVCGSAHVSKALMAPAVSTARKKEKLAMAAGAEQKQILARLQELAREIASNSEDVGDRFAEEARKIHYGETEARGIRGAASGEEVSELLDEGIGVFPLPVLPDDLN
ncbi:MAG: DUF1178 family protein [Notoacmeibacter sp.]|nr:DUF1178 family protein [Notoacmeibacter sp.]